MFRRVLSIASRHFPVALSGLLGVAVLACQETSSKSGKSPFTVKRCPAGTDCSSTSQRDDSDDDDDDGQNTDPNSAARKPSNPDDGPTGYIFTTQEVKAISPIVKPYETPEFRRLDETTDPASDTTRRFIDRQTNRVMDLPALTPGRNIEVVVTRDPAINAFADGFQRVFVNTGSLQQLNAIQMLAVLCHEVAHSARNHQLELARYEASDELGAQMAEVYADVDEYLERQYDQTTRQYVHKLSTYRAVRAKWDEVEPLLAVASKRAESEADIVGAIICGKSGMTAATFSEALGQALTTISGESGSGGIVASDLHEGERFEMAPQETFSFLFPKDSHPTDVERTAQLTRLVGTLTTHHDKAQTIFADWQSEYATVSGAGLGLTSEDLAPPAITTTSGRVVRRPRRSCTHQH